MILKMNRQVRERGVNHQVSQEDVATRLLWDCLERERLTYGHARERHIAGVRGAIGHGARVTDEMMIYAVEWNRSEVVGILLDGGGNANVVPHEAFGRLGCGTLLAFAVVRGSVAAMESLLSGGALVDGHEADGLTPLMWAGYYDDIACTSTLIKAGACVNAVDTLGRTALLLASSDGGRNVVELLLNSGAEPNVADATGMTPLMASTRYGAKHWATNEPRRYVAELLLARGADANAVDIRGHTALLRATEYHAVDMCEKDGEENTRELNLQLSVLLEGGTSVNAFGVNRCTALMNVCRWKTFRGELPVKLLLDAGADVSHVDCLGNTALIIASECNTVSVVRTLISAGADVNMQNNAGCSALMQAAAENDVEVVQHLLHAGAQVDSEDLSGQTALLATVKYPGDCFIDRPSRRAIARVLLQSGANINKAGCDGNTVLHLVGDYHNRETMNEAHSDEIVRDLQEFVSAGADVNAVGAIGATPLMNVCRTQTHRSVDMVHLLLDHGADINAVDDHGMSALHLVGYWSRFNCDRIAAALLSRGADITLRDNYGRNVANVVDLFEDAAQELAIVLIRGGVLFDGVDLSMHEMPLDAWVQCRELKLELQHICREKIRYCLMAREPGERIEKLAARLPVPQPIVEYIANVKRYVFDDGERDSWKVE